MAESNANEETIKTNSEQESSTTKDKDMNGDTLSSMQTENSTSITRRHVTPNSPKENRDIILMADDGNDRDDDVDVNKPRLERRQIFNLIKYFISIVLAVSDITFDWVEYFEMNKRGNYSIVLQRRSTFTESVFTHECQGQGETLQLIFLVFAIVGTVLSILQIFNIMYQLFYEFKGVDKEKRLVHEFVETFVFLFFIEIQQIFLIMGFYHVCTLDCDVNGPEIFIATNGIISYVRIFWRFFTSLKLCSSHLTTKRRRKVQFAIKGDNNCCRIVGIIILLVIFPIAIPFVCIYCILCGSKKTKHGEKPGEKVKWKCMQSCKCCILRCFPSRFEEPDTKACDCTCRKCMSCEQFCKCCVLRCFPKHLPTPLEDACECLCGKCMRCEGNCRCCILRCFPSHLEPPKSDIWTCKCFDCLACEMPCKCCTFRCFPTHLKSPKTDVLTCRCRECLSCKLPCKCFTFRCFPEYQTPPISDWWECTCGACMKCERPCGCCILRCFPSYFDSKEVCTCMCKKFLACQKSLGCCICRCFPNTLDSSKQENCECTCGQFLTCNPKVHPEVVTTQPQTPPPPPPPPKPRDSSKCVACCLGFLSLLIVLLLLLYFFLLVIQVRYVLVCDDSKSFMSFMHQIFAQPYLLIFLFTGENQNL